MAGMKPWKVQAEGLVSAVGPHRPAHVDAQGRAGSGDIAAISARPALLGGTATFTGNATWAPAETWRIAGHMTDWIRRTLRPDLPGKLGFDFDASGAPFGAGGAIDFDLKKLSGTTARPEGQPATGISRCRSRQRRLAVPRRRTCDSAARMWC